MLKFGCRLKWTFSRRERASSKAVTIATDSTASPRIGTASSQLSSIFHISMSLFLSEKYRT